MKRQVLRAGEVDTPSPEDFERPEVYGPVHTTIVRNVKAIAQKHLDKARAQKARIIEVEKLLSDAVDALPRGKDDRLHGSRNPGGLKRKSPAHLATGLFAPGGPKTKRSLDAKPLRELSG